MWRFPRGHSQPPGNCGIILPMLWLLSIVPWADSPLWAKLLIVAAGAGAMAGVFLGTARFTASLVEEVLGITAGFGALALQFVLKAVFAILAACLTTLLVVTAQALPWGSAHRSRWA